MNKKNQEIKCSVETCKFQNSDYCTLNKIQVGNSNNHKAVKIKETACNSFELKNK